MGTNNRSLELTISPNLTSVREIAKEKGYVKADKGSRINILPFDGTMFHYKLSDGYTLADGYSIPPFYSANAHMFSFNYTLPTANNIKSGFEDLKRMKWYDPELDLVALDSEGKQEHNTKPIKLNM